MSLVVAPAVPGGDGPSSYYADRGTEVGRWLGYGANEAGLTGEVDANDFARVLAGRDPRTGGRLITAQGSAGRRPTLGAGTETRRAPDGAPLYGVADVAAALGSTHREAEGLVARASERSPASVAALLGGAVHATWSRTGAFSYRHRRGRQPLGHRGRADRCEQARAAGPIPTRSRPAGGPADQLSLGEAARLAGVTDAVPAGPVPALPGTPWRDRASARRTGSHPDAPTSSPIAAPRASGSSSGRISSPSSHRRAAPAVRVGYDLTLTTEKSLGVLAPPRRRPRSRRGARCHRGRQRHRPRLPGAPRRLGAATGQAGPRPRLDGGVVPPPHQPGTRPVPSPPQRRRQHRRRRARHASGPRRPGSVLARPGGLCARHRRDAPPAHRRRSGPVAARSLRRLGDRRHLRRVGQGVLPPAYRDRGRLGGVGGGDRPAQHPRRGAEHRHQHPESEEGSRPESISSPAGGSGPVDSDLDPESLERCAGQTRRSRPTGSTEPSSPRLTSPEDGLCAGSSIFTRV